MGIRELLSFAAFIGLLIRGCILIYRADGKNEPVTRQGRFIERAKKNGCVTKARVVKHTLIHGDPDSKSSINRDTRVHVTYEYRVNGVDYRKKQTFSSFSSSIPEYPYQMDIYYDPQNPKKAKFNSSQGSGLCLLTIIEAVAALFIIYHGLTFLFYR